MLADAPNMLGRIQRRGWVAWRMTRLYRNWPTALLDKLHLVRPGPIVYHLRDKLELSLRAHSYDAYIIKEIWIDNVYTSAPGFAIQKNWVIADIGGHKGIFSVFAATRADGVKVYAFEASSENCAALRHNLQRNKLTNVEIFNVAVSGSDGEATLHLYPDDGQNSLLQRSDSSLRPVADIKVQAWSLSRVLKAIASPVNLLKMDIEGMECEALLSCPQEALQAVERIALEYHDDLVQTPHHLSDLVGFLNAIGFSTRSYPAQNILVAERLKAN
jgi:FkbM family methyltransferase